MSEEIRVQGQDYEMVSVEALKIHPENARRGSVEVIRQSIERNGWYGALVVQRSTGFCLAGNHRLRAAKELQIEHVPVLWLDVDDATARRVLLADNRTSDGGFAMSPEDAQAWAESRNSQGRPGQFKQVVLLIAEEDFGAFSERITSLSKRFGTQGVTATILDLVRRIADSEITSDATPD